MSVDIWWFRLIEPREVNRIALMIADAYGFAGKSEASNKCFVHVVDRAPSAEETAYPFVGMARTALGLETPILGSLLPHFYLISVLPISLQCIGSRYAARYS